MREHPGLAGRTGITWDLEAIAAFYIAVGATDYDEVDYLALCEAAS